VTSTEESNNQKSGWQGFANGKGATSFWVKPSFSPASSGKIRSLWDFSRFHQGCYYVQNYKSSFALWFLPMQKVGGTSTASTFVDPRTFLFCAATPFDDYMTYQYYGGTKFGLGRYEKQVNSLGLPEEATRNTYFDQHRWTHVIMSWDMIDPVGGSTSYSYDFGGGATTTYTYEGTIHDADGGFMSEYPYSYGDTTGYYSYYYGTGGMGTGAGGRFILNGTDVGVVLGSNRGKYVMWYHDPVSYSWGAYNYTSQSLPPDPVTGLEMSQTVYSNTQTLKGIYANTVRLGNPQQITASFGDKYGYAWWGQPQTNNQKTGHYFQGNFSADSTFDEFYCWDSPAVGVAAGLSIWKKGRYVAAGLNGDAWLSPNMTFVAAGPRTLPPSSAVSPGGSSPTPPPVGTSTVSVPVSIHGVSFTWYAEETLEQSGSMKRVLWDYSSSTSPVGGKYKFLRDQRPRCDQYIEPMAEVAIVANGSVVQKCTDDGFTKVGYGFDPATTQMQYGVRFLTKGTGAFGSAQLQASPVFDDITIYYVTDDSRFLEYYTVVAR
jgi:hypothetical protein